MLVHWNWLSLAWQVPTPTFQAQAPTAEGQTIYLILGAVFLVLIVIWGILWDWRRRK